MREMPEHIDRVLGAREQFIQGDIAIAYGAILAGCSYFAGYPITPATEIAESLARLLPRIGGTYIQMEDEIASIAAVIGASWTGAKAMTATSGPGFSLMQENIGYACMTETPCVIVDVQRSGPSTGQPTEAAQGDMMQARWGPHGDHEIIALAPSSVQECLDMTVRAFHLAERFRNPVLVMTDGEVGHMREMVRLPRSAEVERVERVQAPAPTPQFRPFEGGPTQVPLLPDFGRGFHIYVTGLTHDETGRPTTDDAQTHTRMVTRLCEKISGQREALTWVDWQEAPEAKVGLLSYGITARAATAAAAALTQSGRPTVHLRLRTVWPFPVEAVQDLAQKVDVLFVPEMNLGQIVHPVLEAVQGACKVVALPKIGGIMHTPRDIIQAVRSR